MCMQNLGMPVGVAFMTVAEKQAKRKLEGEGGSAAETQVSYIFFYNHTAMMPWRKFSR